MCNKPLTTRVRIILTAFAIPALSQVALAQTTCLNTDAVNQMLAQIQSSQSPALNEQLHQELLNLAQKTHVHLNAAVAENQMPEIMKKTLAESRQENFVHLCSILKEYGWPSRGMAGEDGTAAAFLLLRNSGAAQLQKDLLPVVLAAVRKGELARPDFANYFDRLRLSLGLMQVFGTEATVNNGFLVVFPIEAESHVDDRRKEFGLEPLADYFRFLEQLYQIPLIRSPGALHNSFVAAKDPIEKALGSGLFTADFGSDEVVRVDTRLVNLNVSVYSRKLRTQISTLEQKDFVVREDGRQEAISFFGATDMPFDLVLLLDLSGSTSEKRDLIRKTTRRFIEASRPADRVAIVTFSDSPTVVASLTSDRAKLLASVKRIEGDGGSKVWDALNFTLDHVMEPKSGGRRRAVVFMTDGADNNLLGWNGRGSRISFADLLETVRRSDTLIVPIYLDTEGHDELSHRIYANARKTLALLADESGGLYYEARKINDLKDVYEQVIGDLGKVYSLGYRPTNEKRDGSWRTVKVEISGQTDLVVRTRPGYYAN
jgi:VWFA-related protein